MTRFYTVLGTLLVLFLAMAQYRGWSLLSTEDVKSVPQSVRNNPGTYRSHYFFGGK